MNKQLQKQLLNKQVQNSLNSYFANDVEKLMNSFFSGFNEEKKETEEDKKIDKPAKELFSYYQTFIKVGFNEDQAFQLLLKFLRY